MNVSPIAASLQSGATAALTAAQPSDGVGDDGVGPTGASGAAKPSLPPGSTVFNIRLTHSPARGCLCDDREVPASVERTSLSRSWGPFVGQAPASGKSSRRSPELR